VFDQNNPKKLDKAAFEEIFLSNYASLFSLGYKMSGDRDLSKDLIQTLFMELWENWHKIGEVTYWNAYLRKAFYRKMVLALKQNRLISGDISDKNMLAAAPSYEDLLIQFQSDEASRLTLQTALAQLPEQERAVLNLRFYDGLSYAEIAESTGKSKQTIYNQVFNALTKLRNGLLG
jgi:RNA polymerase sigma factor (sigma-70 family)